MSISFKKLMSWSHFWESTCQQFLRMSTVKWWRPPVSRDHNSRLLRLCRIILVWGGFKIFHPAHRWCDSWWDYLFEVFCEILHFLIRLLLVGFNCSLHDEYLFIRIFIHFVDYFWNLEAWGMNDRIKELVQWLWFGDIWRKWEFMSKQPDEIIVFVTWFGLRKFGRLGDRF